MLSWRSIQRIQKKRLKLWNQYNDSLNREMLKGVARLPSIPEYATNNAHMFYLVFQDMATRSKAIDTLKKEGILAVFHYLSLHKSKFYINNIIPGDLSLSNMYSDCLLRLPLFYDLSTKDVKLISTIINDIKNS